MNPIEAVDMAAELHEHMTTLHEYDTTPVRHASDIQFHAAEARACVLALYSYLLNVGA